MVRLTLLLAQLRQLAGSIGEGSDSLHNSLTVLLANLRVSAQSCHGLQLRIVQHGWAITLTEFTGFPVSASGASLRVDLSLLVLDADPASRFVFYAEAPGAFVDLAADLQYAMGTTRLGRSGAGQGPAEGEMRLMVKLDGDLPPVSTASGLVGLIEFATINRAVGMLMDRGLSVDAAHKQLRRGAAATGVEAQAFAARMLRRES